MPLDAEFVNTSVCCDFSVVSLWPGPAEDPFSGSMGQHPNTLESGDFGGPVWRYILYLGGSVGPIDQTETSIDHIIVSSFHPAASI